MRVVPEHSEVSPQGGHALVLRWERLGGHGDLPDDVPLMWRVAFIGVPPGHPLHGYDYRVAEVATARKPYGGFVCNTRSVQGWAERKNEWFFGIDFNHAPTDAASWTSHMAAREATAVRDALDRLTSERVAAAVDLVLAAQKQWRLTVATSDLSTRRRSKAPLVTPATVDAVQQRGKKVHGHE